MDDGDLPLPRDSSLGMFLTCVFSLYSVSAGRRCGERRACAPGVGVLVFCVWVPSVSLHRVEPHSPFGRRRNKKKSRETPNMVQRVTYRRRHCYATKSNKIRKVKTPGALWRGGWKRAVRGGGQGRGERAAPPLPVRARTESRADAAASSPSHAPCLFVASTAAVYGRPCRGGRGLETPPARSARPPALMPNAGDRPPSQPTAPSRRAVGHGTLYGPLPLSFTRRHSD